MNACVVDTNVASFMLDDRPEIRLYETDFEEDTVFHISFQTVAELRLGALNRGWGTARRGLLEAFISSMEIVEYSDPLCHRWAEAMHAARLAGRRLEAGDAWIAATASPTTGATRQLNRNERPTLTSIRCKTG